MFSIIRSIPGNISIAANGAYIFRKIIASPINLSVEYFSKKTAIRKKLGIPKPPEKPPNAFMRFVQEKRTSATTNQCDLVQIAALHWKTMNADQKQPYYQTYKKDFVSGNQYSKDSEEYRKSIDQDKLMAVDTEMKQQMEIRLMNIERRNYRKMLHELGKPKVPVTSYLQFRLDCLKEGMKNSHIKEKWATLDEKIKKKYETDSAERQALFDKHMIQWEAKMVAQGRGHLVRKNTLEKQKIKELENRSIIKKIK